MAAALRSSSDASARPGAGGGFGFDFVGQLFLAQFGQQLTQRRPGAMPKSIKS
jgi:hypothetical protein